jgi:hypothetical protein
MMVPLYAIWSTEMAIRKIRNMLKPVETFIISMKGVTSRRITMNMIPLQLHIVK